MVTKNTKRYTLSGTEQNEFYGLSTDAKPDGENNGDALMEMDTGKVWFWNKTGGTWLPWGS